MTENKIDFLFAKFQHYTSMEIDERVSEEEQIKFNQGRLKNIEDLARAFVDYYNMNTYTKPKTLSLEEIKVQREKKSDHSQDATFYKQSGIKSAVEQRHEEQQASNKESEHNTKHKYLFDKIFHMILKNHLDNNKEIQVYKIVETAKAIARVHLYEGHNLGNSPWDPR